MALSFGASPFKIIRGLTWSEALTIRDAALLPVNLTGATFLMRVRTTIGATTSLLELSTANGRLLSPAPTTGVINMLVSADDTLLLPEAGHKKAVYVYDMVIIRAGPPQVREPVVGGRVSVRPQVTRSWTV